MDLIVILAIFPIQKEHEEHEKHWNKKERRGITT